MAQDQTASPNPQTSPAENPGETPVIQPTAELHEVQADAAQCFQSMIDGAQVWFADAVETLMSVSTLNQALAIVATDGR